MSDIRTGLKTKEEYAEAASISFVPSILALQKLKQIPLDSDKITFKELKIESDSVTPSLLSEEMTEINHAKVSQSSRVFNAYGKGISLVKKNYRNANVNVQSFHDQIIRNLSIKFGNAALAGEGGNNGLILATGGTVDSNVYTPSSAEIPAFADDGFSQVEKIIEIATSLNIAINDYTGSNNLSVFFYGADLLPFLGRISAGQETNMRQHIRNSFSGKNISFVDISALETASAAGTAITGNGIIVAANDLTLLEHCGLPEIQNEGVDERRNEYWANYFYGSANVRPETYGAVIKQVITFAS